MRGLKQASRRSPSDPREPLAEGIGGSELAARQAAAAPERRSLGAPGRPLTAAQEPRALAPRATREPQAGCKRRSSLGCWRRCIGRLVVDGGDQNRIAPPRGGLGPQPLDHRPRIVRIAPRDDLVEADVGVRSCRWRHDENLDVFWPAWRKRARRREKSCVIDLRGAPGEQQPAEHDHRRRSGSPAAAPRSPGPRALHPHGHHLHYATIGGSSMDELSTQRCAKWCQRSRNSPAWVATGTTPDEQDLAGDAPRAPAEGDRLQAVAEAGHDDARRIVEVGLHRRRAGVALGGIAAQGAQRDLLGLPGEAAGSGGAAPADRRACARSPPRTDRRRGTAPGRSASCRGSRRWRRRRRWCGRAAGGSARGRRTRPSRWPGPVRRARSVRSPRRGRGRSR